MTINTQIEPFAPSLVMFDLDGTLIDSVPDLASAVDYSLQKLALPEAGEALVRQWVGNGAAVLLERALHFALSENQGQSQYTTIDAPSISSALREQALSYFFDYYEAHAAEKTRLYPHVTETLDALHRKRKVMAVVTNKPKRFVAPILEALKIFEYFDCVIGGDDLALKKPHPLPLLHCMERLGFRPEQSLMVGDSRNDIEAARQANVLVAAVNYGYNHGRPVAEENPDFLLSDFSQLITQVIMA